ncbi:hypothetical protein [Sphingomonas sp. 28-63-12]|uniref:hypothetical protein n=1 Tax=Sphingomonas sp. 28-63-12 TaxID=1970434 RepID=UPI0035A8DB27
MLPKILLIADDGLGAREGESALALAGARAVGPVAMAVAPAALAHADSIDGVLIEAAGSDDGALTLALDAAAILVAGSTLPVVIVLEDSQIDQVASRLLTGRVQLLCSPTLAERVTALVIALTGKIGNRVRESGDSHDRDAERFNQLNAEVARIAETLARLAKADPSSARPMLLGDRTTGYRGPGAGDGAGISPGDVRQVIRGRRLRDQYFGTGLFEDPAWDMLLDLFAADLERARVSVSSLCIAAAVAPTTALRWISRMTEAGLFEREADPFDRRRAFMQLSTQARDGMRDYWLSVKRAGGVIG